MNIMLTNYCNLKCPYCFSLIEEKPVNISDENMQFFISFLKKTGDRQLKLLGGEPLLHPNFEKYVRSAIMDSYFESIVIITNAYTLTPDLAESIVTSKTEFLINLNNPRQIGAEVFNTTLRNIAYLRDVFKRRNLIIKIRLALNIYEPDFDFAYIINASRQLSIYGIRFVLTVPVRSGIVVTLDYYRQFIPQIMKFLDACYTNQIYAQIDCNNIPPCLYSDAEMRNLIALSNHDICNKQRCFMPLDVSPNLDVTRCFPFFEKYKTNITYFNDGHELVKYFAMNIDTATYEIPTFKECETCTLFKEKKCQGGCLAYKFK